MRGVQFSSPTKTQPYVRGRPLCMHGIRAGFICEVQAAFRVGSLGVPDGTQVFSDVSHCRKRGAIPRLAHVYFGVRIKCWRKCTTRKFLEEDDANFMWEMSTYPQRDTGLPMCIWVDDCGAYKRAGHSQRVKFQPDKRTTHLKTYEFASMSIKDLQIFNLPQKHGLSSGDIGKLKLWVTKNRDILLLVADKKITRQEFEKRMVKV